MIPDRTQHSSEASETKQLNINRYIPKSNILRKLTSIALLLSVALSLCSHANFENALKTYQSGNFAEAKRSFEALAAIGDRSSLFNLGVMHYRGELGEKDSVMAYVLMQLAIENSDSSKDEAFEKTKQLVFRKLSSEQKDQAKRLYRELIPTYGISNIRNNIYPKPLSDEDCTQKVRPIKRKTPSYPLSMLNTGKMGVTQAEYTISPEGYPRDILILRPSHKGFTKASISALRQFIYEPTIRQIPIYNHRNNIIYHIGKNGTDVTVKTKLLTKKLETLKSSANKGDVIAQYKYGTTLNTFKYFKSYLEKVDLQYSTANEWFTKAAKSGLPHAQFEIGRNMIAGRGCAVDQVNGYKWINAAAVGGYSPAQLSLAKIALSESELSQKKSLAAISWLRNASIANNYPAKVLLAWELSTSAHEQYRNGKEALTLLAGDTDNYYDNLRINETKAAAYAELGNFKKAVKFQKKAKKVAKKLKWTIPLIDERLALYENKKTYSGSYY